MLKDALTAEMSAKAKARRRKAQEQNVSHVMRTPPHEAPVSFYCCCSTSPCHATSHLRQKHKHSGNLTLFHLPGPSPRRYNIFYVLASGNLGKFRCPAGSRRNTGASSRSNRTVRPQPGPTIPNVEGDSKIPARRRSRRAYEACERGRR